MHFKSLISIVCAFAQLIFWQCAMNNLPIDCLSSCQPLHPHPMLILIYFLLAALFFPIKEGGTKSWPFSSPPPRYNSRSPGWFSTPSSQWFLLEFEKCCPVPSLYLDNYWISATLCSPPKKRSISSVFHLSVPACERTNISQIGTFW